MYSEIIAIISPIFQKEKQFEIHRTSDLLVPTYNFLKIELESWYPRITLMPMNFPATFHVYTRGDKVTQLLRKPFKCTNK